LFYPALFLETFSLLNNTHRYYWLIVYTHNARDSPAFLNYVFSQQVAFNVHFDGTGAVIGVEDARTMADLLGTRQQ
jgi:hypothetical protein